MTSTTTDDMVLPRYLTTEQCIIRFAVFLRHFKYLVSSGETPPSVKFGKCSRWSIDMLEFFEAEKQEKRSSFRRKTSIKKN